MKAKAISTGDKFNRWTVIAEAERRAAHRTFFCKCICGTEKRLNLNALLQGTSKSCGCLTREVATKHGMWKSPEYGIWGKMIYRCSKEKRKHHSWRNYGGRGISVCQRWRESFEAFFSDMGSRPPGYSLERLNNEGNYEPSNCKWATASEQRRNKRCSIWERIVLELAKEAAISADWIESQVNAGASDLELARHIARAFKP